MITLVSRPEGKFCSSYFSQTFQGGSSMDEISVKTLILEALNGGGR
jgi:hypothetical protein